MSKVIGGWDRDIYSTSRKNKNKNKVSWWQALLFGGGFALFIVIGLILMGR